MVDTNMTLLEDMRIQEAHAREAQGVIQTVAASIQEQAHSKIASVVSRCLESVFDEPYEFQIHFERKRGKTEARLVFVRNECEYSPMDSSGGGVIDVAAFALRVACLMLSVPMKRRTIVLDEPFKFVSVEYRDSIRDMIELLSEEMSIQFIIVTHISEIKCGEIINV
jgi:DNA repair exonuclease SbcCD ATPase subunit